MKFITFEGCEASGKSTQTRILSEYMESLGYRTVLTKEPGGSRLANQIRSILLTHEVADSLTELLLFSAARRDHVLQINAWLKEGYYVISDRFTDSSLAYQGYAKGLDMLLVQHLNDISTNCLQPDITILLDITLATIKNRINKSSAHTNFYDHKNIEFHNQVKEGFLHVAKLYPERIKIVDANKSVEEVASQVIKVCKEANIIAVCK
ncbi:Thymidylate kinase [Alphaproteobacteria bacterium]